MLNAATQNAYRVYKLATAQYENTPDDHPKKALFRLYKNSCRAEYRAALKAVADYEAAAPQRELEALSARLAAESAAILKAERDQMAAQALARQQGVVKYRQQKAARLAAVRAKARCDKA